MRNKAGSKAEDGNAQANLLTKEESKPQNSDASKKDKAQFNYIKIKPKFKVKDELKSAYRGLWKKFRTLTPFLWTRASIILQLKIVLCFILIGLERVVNVYIPVYTKDIVDSLTETSSQPLEFRWNWIVTYVVLKFLQGGIVGGSGFFSSIKYYLWMEAEQYIEKEIQVELFRHLHNLSLKWHMNRKTGEVLRVLDRGAGSISVLLHMTFFVFGPTIFDLLIAIIYLFTSSNYKFGLTISVTMILYLVSTVLINEWGAKYRRDMNLADNDAQARSVDSLLNFETVKYYGAEKYEVNAFRDAFVKYQAEERKLDFTYHIIGGVQNFIASMGVLVGSLLCSYYIINTDEYNVGDYVLFTTYMVQLYDPVGTLAMQYRRFQDNFVDTESLFDLLRQEQDVVDAPNAKELISKGGGIEFKNVIFKYVPEKVVLKNVSFVVPPGKTVALVGPSGSGKSTIVKLIFRFYDVDSGSIIIDGYNIKNDVTQQSLRSIIGVVPQDTVLFNQTIKYNIQYGRFSATDEQVIEAAKSADIHDRIMSFPDKYETMVGERGLKLSGGEKQRVAIARTLLKAPTIILLDEATSALDTHTERNIQESLNKMCVNRTTLVIAHRLSTIINADEILVLKDGEIVERGRHDNLISNEDGVYASMWKQQQEKNENSTTDEEDTNGKAQTIKSGGVSRRKGASKAGG